jgi:Undecaprenyl-phosphate glucose phosphotransferase
MSIMGAIDIATLATIAVLAVMWRDSTVTVPTYYWLAIGLGTLLALNTHTVAGIYDFRNLTPKTTHLGRLALSWSITILLLIAAFYLVKHSDDFSRTWLILWYGGGLLAMVATRCIIWAWMERQRHSGALALNVVVVGADDAVERLARRIRDTADRETEVVALIPEKGGGGTRQSYEEAVLDLTRRMRVDEVVVAMRVADDPALKSLIRRLGTVPIDVNFCPVFGEIPILSAGIHDRRPMPMLNLYERPLAGVSMVTKRVADIVLSTMLLIMTFPLMVCVAAAIAIDSRGPILFRQLRYGFNNKPIMIYKFRSMIHEERPDPSAPQARRRDPRLTRIGGFLRRSSIDELPQLLNVLKGEMSLVGPRPHAVAHNEKYAKLLDGYFARHRVKPGITGWAQVNGLRGETATLDLMRRRVEHDLYYISNWSLLFDFRILIMTLLRSFVDRQAY